MHFNSLKLVGVKRERCTQQGPAAAARRPAEQRLLALETAEQELRESRVEASC